MVVERDVGDAFLLLGERGRNPSAEVDADDGAIVLALDRRAVRPIDAGRVDRERDGRILAAGKDLRLCLTERQPLDQPVLGALDALIDPIEGAVYELDVFGGDLDGPYDVGLLA